MQNHCFFYILRCSDNSYYIGTATDIKSRIKAHNDGKGANYTKIRRPVQLVYHEKFEMFEEAIRRERQVKKRSRAKKKALINKDIESLKNLI